MLFFNHGISPFPTSSLQANNLFSLRCLWRRMWQAASTNGLAACVLCSQSPKPLRNLDLLIDKSPMSAPIPDKKKDFSRAKDGRRRGLGSRERKRWKKRGDKSQEISVLLGEEHAHLPQKRPEEVNRWQKERKQPHSTGSKGNRTRQIHKDSWISGVALRQQQSYQSCRVLGTKDGSVATYTQQWLRTRWTPARLCPSAIWGTLSQL